MLLDTGDALCRSWKVAYDLWIGCGIQRNAARQPRQAGTRHLDASSRPKVALSLSRVPTVSSPTHGRGRIVVILRTLTFESPTPLATQNMEALVAMPLTSPQKRVRDHDDGEPCTPTPHSSVTLTASTPLTVPSSVATPSPLRQATIKPSSPSDSSHLAADHLIAPAQSASTSGLQPAKRRKLTEEEKEEQRLEKEARAKAKAEKKTLKEVEDKLKAEQKAQKDEERRKKTEEKEQKKRARELKQQQEEEDKRRKERVSQE